MLAPPAERSPTTVVANAIVALSNEIVVLRTTGAAERFPYEAGAVLVRR
jgi:hypothetical protein